MAVITSSKSAEPEAFSSEVDTGSCQENASKQQSRAPFPFHRNGRGSGAGLCPDNLTGCFQFRFTIVEYTRTALCLRSRINCGAILCPYVRFHGRAALGSRKDQTSCSLVSSLGAVYEEPRFAFREG